MAATPQGLKACAIHRPLTRTHIIQSLPDCQPPSTAGNLRWPSPAVEMPARGSDQCAGCPEKCCLEQQRPERQKQPFHVGWPAEEDSGEPQMLSKSQLAGTEVQVDLGDRVSLAQRFTEAQATKGILWEGLRGRASYVLLVSLLPSLIWLPPCCHSDLSSTFTPPRSFLIPNPK